MCLVVSHMYLNYFNSFSYFFFLFGPLIGWIPLFCLHVHWFFVPLDLVFCWTLYWVFLFSYCIQFCDYYLDFLIFSLSLYWNSHSVNVLFWPWWGNLWYYFEYFSSKSLIFNALTSVNKVLSCSILELLFFVVSSISLTLLVSVH